jgi:hypothetical protein
MEQEEIEVDVDALADDAYDRYREEWTDQLEECVCETYDGFVNIKGLGYYKNRPELFVHHTILHLLSASQCTLEVKDGIIKVSWKPKENLKNFCKALGADPKIVEQLYDNSLSYGKNKEIIRTAAYMMRGERK